MLKLDEMHSGISSHALAAKNIKKELAAKWPWVKFSVKSKSYSGGDSVSIHWELGPTTEEVGTIVDKYQNSDFDGMQDLSTPRTSNRAFTEKHGGSKHVFTSRSYPGDRAQSNAFYEQIGKDLCALQGKVYEGQWMRGLCGEHDPHSLGDHIYQVFRVTSFGEGETYAGIEHSGGHGQHWCRIKKARALPQPVPQEALPGQVIKTKHTQKGHDLFVVQLAKRVSRDQFSGLLGEVKALGGYYSSYTLNGAIAGFQFKTEVAALAFLHLLEGKPSLELAQATDARAQQYEAAKVENQKIKADRLRKLAEKMNGEIERKLNPPIGEQNPTARRIRIAEGMRNEGNTLKHTQSVLLAVADAMEAGNIPEQFHGVAWSKKTVHEALHWGRNTPELSAWLKRITDAPKRDEKAEEIRRLENELVGQKLPGFFPTPPDLVARMLDWVKPQAGELVLEPSAGTGAIACACNGGSKVEALEIRPMLRRILELKGVALVGSDFLEFPTVPKYDAVVMNPPFENGQDVQHVRRAFECLKPGGRLAAITSESIMYRSGQKYEDFRQWLEEAGAVIEDIPAGAFEKSGTGVKTRMLFVCK